MNDQPLVSIVCSCKNAAATIRRHIEAVVVAARHYDNIEYVVQDGNSTDETLAIFEEYRAALGDKLKLVSAPDSSGGEGLWRGLSRCTGEIICASLADEELLPDAIPFVAGQFRQHPEIDVIHGDIYQTDLAGNVLFRNPSREFDLVRYLCHQQPMHFAASFFRKSALEKAGLLPLYERQDVISDDFFTWCYLALSARIVYYPEVFAKYAVHDEALSVRPDIRSSIIAERDAFFSRYFSDQSVPEAVRARRKECETGLYTWAIRSLTECNLTEEAGKYMEKMANLNRKPAPAGGRKSKVLILSLPGLSTGDEPIFPLGIGYLLASLKLDRTARAVHYQNAQHVQDQLPELILKYAPDIVGLTCTTFNRGIVTQVCRWLRTAHPEVRIVVGGVHVSFMYEQALRAMGADCVVVGEGEETFRELCRAWDANLPLHDIGGIAFLDGDQVVKTKPRPAIQNLDDLPMPDYSFAGDLMRRSGMGFVISSRGCPVQCCFCSTGSYWGQKVRINSPKRVVDEMEALVANYGVKKIFFHDDTFNLGTARVRQICDEIRARGLKVEWGVSCRVHPVSQEMIDTMVDAGCRHICWGIESGSKQMLERIDKKITQEQIKTAFELCRKHLGTISVGAFTMVGNPGENEATVAESVDFINTLQLTDYPSTAILYILPGTKLYGELLEKHPEIEQYWVESFEIMNYTMENPLGQLREWGGRIAQSGDIVAMDHNRHFWNNVLFGEIPKPLPPGLDGVVSELDQVIPPEIQGDEFYFLIRQLSADEQVRSVLEIGSSAGGGSTEAFVGGLEQNPHAPTLYCMEVSQPRYRELEKRYRDKGFVKCYNTSSVALARFPEEGEVASFYHSQRTALNAYPLERVLGWLRQDLDYVGRTGVDEDGIARIRRENGIERFDMVLIDGSEFTGKPELDQVYGARWILLDDVNGFKNFENYQRLKKDPGYRLYRENWQVRNGYAVFRKVEAELPVHFFTIVLNGEPFIRQHIERFEKLPFAWHWHIVEGVADLVHDTAWSLQLGGKVSDDCHRDGLSNDGTTEYLDELERLYPGEVTLYRKPRGRFWEGKLEMVQAPVENLPDECLLWQVDVDEIWSVEQIAASRNLFLAQPQKTAAFYWCHFFVGPRLVVNSRNCYSQNPDMEWLRTWRYTKGCRWIAHEPPRLHRPLPEGGSVDLACIDPLLHAETEREGLVFQHFAYVLPQQLSFKETYYGYRGALACWQRLQRQKQFPVYLRDFFPWVCDGTTVVPVEQMGVVPVELPGLAPGYPVTVVDGVFFQMNTTGIARVWKSLLCEWAKTDFGSSIVVLDRAGTAPRVEGIRYRNIPAYQPGERDRGMLQQVCDDEGADLFISTYYSTPLTTPSLFLAHDMIPEFTDFYNLADAQWQEKHHAISRACAFVAVSRSTARDLAKLYPELTERIVVAHNGIDREIFSPAPALEVQAFRKSRGLNKPYYLFVGMRQAYKNGLLPLQALKLLPDSDAHTLLYVGGVPGLEPELKALAGNLDVRQADLTDRELISAYSGAAALIYPSTYEGFGLPVLEAMSCRCPVIACQNSSIPEVAGAAALYVSPEDPAELSTAMLQITAPEVRQHLIHLGERQAAKFSWKRMADIMEEVIRQGFATPAGGREKHREAPLQAAV